MRKEHGSKLFSTTREKQSANRAKQLMYIGWYAKLKE